MEATQLSFGPVAELGPQLSPDGKSVAFEYFPKDRPNLPQIWVMDRASGFESARPLVDNSNYNAEFSWSPDGNWICFISNSLTDRPITNQIYKVRLRDGAIRQITHFEKGKALGDSTSWSKDDLIAFENDHDIYAASASDGSVKKLVEVGSQMPSLTPSEIRWSPDNSRLAFTGKEDQRGSERSRIWIADVRVHRTFPVTDSGWDSTPSWYDNNQLLFSRGESKEETKICLLTLATGRMECLTKGNIDLSPWGDARKGELFFARDTTRSTSKNSAGYFAGFHIWRSRLVN
jgi:Tol biopolymer transport system component